MAEQYANGATSTLSAAITAAASLSRAVALVALGGLSRGAGGRGSATPAVAALLGAQGGAASAGQLNTAAPNLLIFLALVAFAWDGTVKAGAWDGSAEGRGWDGTAQDGAWDGSAQARAWDGVASATAK